MCSHTRRDNDPSSSSGTYPRVGDGDGGGEPVIRPGIRLERSLSSRARAGDGFGSRGGAIAAAGAASAAVSSAPAAAAAASAPAIASSMLRVLLSK